MTIFDVPLGCVGAPQAVVDQDAVVGNLRAMRDAARGVPLRIATKSIRVRGIVEWALAQPGVAGVLAYSVREASWLVGCGASDVLVAYPSVDLDAIREVARDDAARAAVTLMVDSADHVEMLDSVAREVGAGPLRVALDLDMSLRVGRLVVGAHRSGLHAPEQGVTLARRVHDARGLSLVGCMFYEAQVAGVPDSTPAHAAMKWVSMLELGGRRRAMVEALRQLGDLEIVNGGGTGTVHVSGRDGVLTDIAVGSGLFTPLLFDHYRALRTQPAAYFVAPVVRKPDPDTIVTFSGGYIASGPASASRVPRPVHPAGLRYFGTTGAGEVQTPLRGDVASSMRIGDVVWFRHAKAGEMCERFDVVRIVENGVVTRELPTYRGEGKNFG